jgi:type IV secretory pathway protease TraF
MTLAATALRVHGLWLLAVLAVGGCATRSDTGLASLQAYRLHTIELPVGEGSVVIAHAPHALALDDAQLQGWVSDAARAIHAYYGRLPVQRLQVVVDSTDGQGPQSGTAFGFSTPVIRMTVGRATRSEDLARDWMMTHEMVHLAFPRVAQRHHWLEEGLATYVEPIARVQAGQLPVAQVWRDLVHGLPHGLPQAGDRGLDHTPTWGRTYWGGALFCLLADIEIRRQTGNRHGLQDALRGVVDAGGNIGVLWSIEHALDVADRAVGVDVLSRLYADMRATPVQVDLATLWRQLGVSVHDDDIVFDDDAPLAAVRKAITAARAPPPSPWKGEGRDGGRL